MRTVSINFSDGVHIVWADNKACAEYAKMPYDKFRRKLIIEGKFFHENVLYANCSVKKSSRGGARDNNSQFNK
jgi:hypothetical protein